MASFTNVATLSYNGGQVTSNVVTGEIQAVLAATKTAVREVYAQDGVVTYAVALTNSGTQAFTDLSVSDDLGGYVYGTATVYPLTYVADSVRYYVNGVLQAAPTVTAGPPMVISGLSVPAGGSGVLLYQARVNQYAPLATGSTIVNTATVSGTGLTADLIATETVTVQEGADLAIQKALSPSVVSENGQLTYTFTIQNFGNTAVAATDAAVITDTFDPILRNLSVTFNGTAWTAPTNYTYDETTGVFATAADAITVPAATYVQNSDGSWAVSPGTSTLVVTGTI